MPRTDAKYIYAGCVSLLLLIVATFYVNWQRGTYDDVSPPEPIISTGAGRQSYSWACTVDVGGLIFGISQFEGLKQGQLNTAIIVAGEWISFPFRYWVVLLILSLPLIAALLLPAKGRRTECTDGEGATP
ncbi:MAG: hypothetical protein JWM16_3745 [Verrucomicrobiales bacterium]|nr:hypothetical protein [Verrucomicrobiales bacterium]